MLDVTCPIRGHNHVLKIEPDPERPDMVIARCGERVVYRAPVTDPEDEAVDHLYSMTVTQLRALPEWNKVPSPRPAVKDRIVSAILEVRKKPYQVRTYKE